MKGLGIFLAATLLAVPARAEGVRAMTLDDALAFAHEHQPDLREALARVRSAQADADTTNARWYPLVTGTAQLLATTTNNTTGSYLGVAGFDNPRISATLPRTTDDATFVPHASSLVGLGIRQELYDFGRISAQHAADELRTDAARADAGNARLFVDYGVRESYFAVYAAKSILSAAEKALGRAVLHRDLAREGVATGLRRPIELTRAEAVVDRYELERIKGRRGIVAAEAALAARVGVKEPLLDTIGELPQPRDLPSLDTTLGEAATKNPELRAALARIRAQEEQTRAIRAETRPNLLVSAAISGNAGHATPTSGALPVGGGLLPDVPNWDVGAVLSWPIFDETVTERVHRSRAEEDAARERAAAVRLRLVAAVEQAWNDVLAARDALPVLEHQRNAAVANYDQASARYEVGLGNAIELADAEELRVQAEIQLAIGAFDLARARASLGRAAAEGQ